MPPDESAPEALPTSAPLTSVGAAEQAVRGVVGIPCSPVVQTPSPDTLLRPINAPPRPLLQYLTTFHLVVVAVDPFTNESAWIIETAGRVLSVFSEADCRVGWIVTGDPEECRQFLGPWADRFLTFADPSRDVIRSLDLQRLPALVHLGMDGSVVAAASPRRPAAWQQVVDELARMLQWKAPRLPAPGDPAPYAGSPALG